MGPISTIRRDRLGSYPPFLCALLILGAATLAGCGGPELSPVAGVVYFDGQPLPLGDVVFFPDDGAKIAGADLPRSKIGSDGGYQLATAGRAGAPVGKYRVVVVAQTRERPADAPANPFDLYSLVPIRYSVHDSTPLRQEVAADRARDNYDLKLKREE